MNIFVSTDQDLVDFGWLVPALQGEYWGWNLTEEKIKAQTKNALCFGVYKNDEICVAEVPKPIREQLAYARVITDKVSFSFICDVIVDKTCRRKQIGTLLMETLLAHQDVKKTIAILGTKEAWTFYEKFRFGPPAAPMMQRDPLR